MNKEYYLCMNTGGTSSDVGAFLPTGEQVFHYKFGVGSPAVEYDEAIFNIISAIKKVIKAMDNTAPLFMELGISGVGAIVDLAHFKSDLERQFKTKVEITNDAIVELYGIMDGADEGIMSVAGTGNATVGVKGNVRHLVGGGGPLLKEEGSCYSAVLECSLLVKDYYERRMELTPFLKGFLALVGVEDFPSLKAYFYHHTKSELASFATYIIDAANNQEPEAMNLVSQQAYFLVKQVKIMKEALNIENGAILGLYGGFTHHNHLLIKKFKSYLKQESIDLKVCTKKVDPLKGAFILAKLNGGAFNAN